MELVAPAGSWDGMVACIESGADAVYLGLKDWNARNRAENFSLQALREACAWCHERQRQVYLTLNTLLRDEEVSAILSLFASEDFTLPDAVIVSDPGLMLRLRQTFPAVELHASTQFGAHSADDLRFLETLGIRRAVLARELTIGEIQNLAEGSNVELEVFAWGSQCLGISGDCTLSGLLLGGSGDRGRCLGSCRDIHRAKKAEGQLLYPNDLDIGGDFVQLLIELGVAAIKVEGRMRSPDALSAIVSRLRGQIDSFQARSSTAPTASSLGGHLPVPGYIRYTLAVDKRDVRKESPSLQLDKPDGTFTKAKWDHAYPARLGESSLKGLRQSADRISFLEQIHFDREAASIAVSVSQGRITELDCVDASGNRRKTSLSQIEIQGMPVTFQNAASLVHELRLQLKELSIYDLTISGEIDGAVQVNLEDLLVRIRAAVSPQSLPPTSHGDEGTAPSLAVESFNEDHLRYFLDGYDIPIVVPVMHLTQVARVIKKFGAEQRIIFRLPEVDWKSFGVREVMRLVHGHGIMVTKLRQMQLVKSCNPSFIEADYTVDCWNGATLEQLRANGVRRVTITPEWSPDEALAFGKAHDVPVEIIVAGRLTALITRHCWSETLECKGHCESWQPIHNAEKGYGLRLYCGTPGLRRLVFEDPLPFLGLRPNRGIDLRCRYVASYDSMEEITKNMAILTAPLVPEAEWRSTIASHKGWTVRLRGSVK